MGELLLVLIAPVIAAPFWGVCLSLFLDFFLPTFPVYGFPPRNFVVAALLFPLAAEVLLKRKGFKIDLNSKKIIVVSGLFCAWGVFLSLYHQVRLLAFLGRVVVPFCLMCTLFFYIDSLQKVKRFLFCLALTLTVVSIVGVFQFFQADWAWDLHSALNPVVAEGKATYDVYSRIRIPGLSFFSISFAYSLCAFVPILLALAFSRNYQYGRSMLFKGIASLAGVVLLLTLSRSAILGLFMGLIWVFAAGRKFKDKLLATFVVIVFLVGVNFLPMVESRLRADTEQQRGTVARIVLGIRVALENPLGTGGTSEAFFKSVENNLWTISDYEGANAAYIESSHNQFLNTWVYYGLPGLVMLFYFYYLLSQLLKSVRQNPANMLIDRLALGLGASVIAYTVHSLFHNAGPFVGEVYFWYIVGLILALNRINVLCLKSA